jgi:exosortase family protein XrtF
LYLSQFTADEIDGVTRLVAEHTEQLMSVFKADFQVKSVANEDFLRLIYNGSYVARMIEGCNAISIIILFISFVFSFSGKIKTTSLFLLFGSCIVYFLNVIRIAFLCVLMYNFPEKEGLLHGVLFPLFIYGVVFLLWLVWVNKFASDGKRNP